MNKKLSVAAMAVLGAVSFAGVAQAREYPIGGPVIVDNMEIAANYLVGIEMAPAMKNMAMGADVIHLETDIHTTADNVWGFPEGAWMPYLTINYTLTKEGSQWQAKGQMHAMTAKDGPHYANNVKMDGAGKYTVVLSYSSPEANGFMHHVDKATGVPSFWEKPITEKFTFSYPQK